MQFSFRIKLRLVAIASAATLAVSLFPCCDAVAQTSFESTWKGNYICAQGPTGATLTISNRLDNKLDAKFRFYSLPQNPSVPSGEFEMVGRVSADISEISLSPGRWLKRPPGYGTFAITGVLDPDHKRMQTKIFFQGCRPFSLVLVNGELGPLGPTQRPTPLGAAVVSTTHPKSPGATERKRDAPEIIVQPTNLGSIPKELRYSDSSMHSQQTSPIGVEPIDIVFQWLYDHNFTKCLASSKIILPKSQAATTHRIQMEHFGTKRYVLTCSGACKELSYIVRRGGIGFSFGQSLPYPVLQESIFTIGSRTIEFDFRRPAAKAASTIELFQWTATSGDYGPGCEIF